MTQNSFNRIGDALDLNQFLPEHLSVNDVMEEPCIILDALKEGGRFGDRVIMDCVFPNTAMRHLVKSSGQYVVQQMDAVAKRSAFPIVGQFEKRGSAHVFADTNQLRDRQIEDVLNAIYGGQPAPSQQPKTKDK